MRQDRKYLSHGFFILSMGIFFMLGLLTFAITPYVNQLFFSQYSEIEIPVYVITTVIFIPPEGV